MKKLFSSIVAVAFTASLFAQAAIPNAGFENWAGGNPTGWGTSDGIITTFGQADPGGVERDTSIKYAGTSSIRCKTDSVTIALVGQSILLPGVASLGVLSLNLVTQNLNLRGIQYTDRPDSFSFAYRYTSGNAGLDTGGVLVRLTKFVGGAVKDIGQAFLVATTTPSFVVLKGKVEYQSLLAPDSLYIQLLSSASQTGGYKGSTLWADDLKFLGLDTAFKAYTNAQAVETLCAGDTLSVEGDNIPGFTYRWLNNNVAVPGATAYKFSATTPGLYSLELTNGSQVDTSDVFQVVVNALPTVSLNGNPDTLCLNATAITLVGATPPGGTFAGPGVTTSTFTPSTAGVGSKTITYSYRDGNGCRNSATEVIVVKSCTSIEDVAADYDVNVYPNPAQNGFTITADDRLKGGEIIISDISGKVVGRKMIENNQTAIDASTWSNGNYVFQIVKGAKAITSGKVSIAK